MLDYRVQTFLTLYQEMNYRKTAQLLRMTQPGVTQHVQYLESYYGVRLFHYDGRKLHRTEAAEALKCHFDSITARERSLRQKLAEDNRIHLEIGATKTIGEYVLPPVLERFLADPNHSIQFVIDNTENLLRLLEASRLDFTVIEGVFDKQHYGSRLYQREAFVGICATDHPFAGKKVSLQEALGCTLVVREQGSGTRKLLEQAVQDRGYELSAFSRCVSVSHFSLIRDLVARGEAITFAYAPVAAGDARLDTFLVEDMHIVGEFNFVYCDAEVAEEKIALFFGDAVHGAPMPVADG